MRRHNTILGSLIALGLTSNLWALPQDPTTVHGQVQIQNNGANFLQILQTTPQAILNWNQFNIGLGETVRFLQPNQQAAILNRVTGVDPSLIQGMLQANGRVFLLNPNGILFGPNSVVDVGSFTASTLKMSNEDFLNGTYKLAQDGTLPLAALTNQGQIRVAEGGFVVLVSPLLDNQGMILAQSGHVNLGATTQATFSVDGRGLVQFTVPDGFDPQFTGGGQGGTVLLQPGQMSQLLHQVVSNPTLVEAGSFQAGANGQTLAHGAEGILLNSGTINTDGSGGTIRLDSSQASILPGGGVLSSNSQNGDGGDVRLLSAGRTLALGTITAAANGTGQGGFVEVSGKDLWLLGNVNVGSAQGLGGTILLDPTDITIIDGAGGTFDGGLPTPGNAGAGTVSVTAMQGQSAVNLNATNDVTYNGTGFNLSATALTVVAGNDILFNTNGSIQAATLNLNATRDLVIAGSGGLTVASQTGALNLSAGRNLALTANNALTVSSPSQANLQAGTGDVNLRSGQGSGTFFNAPVTTLSAGRNITLRQSDLLQSNANPVNLEAGNDVSLLDAGTGGLVVNLGSLNVTAGQDFVGNASNGNFAATVLGGDLKVVAGRNLDLRASSNIGLFSNSGATTLRAQDIRVAAGGEARIRGASGVAVNATANDLVVTSNGALEVSSASGAVRADAGRDIGLLAGNALALNSPVKTTVNATRDLSLRSGQSSGTFLDGPRTDLIAGQNLTLSQSDLLQSSFGPVNLAAGKNVSLLDAGSGGLVVNLGSLNVTAGQDFVGNASNGSFATTVRNGDLNVVAAANIDVRATSNINLFSNTGATTLRAQDVEVRAGGETRIRGASGVTVNATANDLLVTSNGALEVSSASGAVRADAGRDIGLLAGNALALNSPVKTTVNATRDLSLRSGQGSGTFLDGPRTDLIAGQNLTLSQSDLLQNSFGAVNLAAGKNVSLLDAGSGGLVVNLGSLNVTAGQDFVGNASNGSFATTVRNGDLNVVAAANIDVRATSNINLFSNTGATTLRAQDVEVRAGGETRIRGASGVTVNATANDLLVTSNGALEVSSASGAVRADAGRDIGLLAGNALALNSPVKTTVNATRDLSLRSGQGSGTFLDGPRTDLIAGQNLTLSQSDLLQNSFGAVNLAAGKNVSLLDAGSGGLVVNLGSLNVTAGQDFVGNASNGSFATTVRNGDLNVVAAANIDVRATSNINLFSNTGATTLRAQDVEVRAGGETRIRGASGVTVNATANDLLVTSNGALEVSSASGAVRADAGRDIGLLAGNALALNSPVKTTVNATRDLSLRSGQGSGTFLDGPRTDLIAGQNLTLSQSDLLQNNFGAVNLAAGKNVSLLDAGSGGVRVVLGSLNVTAAEDFIGNASNGNLGIQTTGGIGLTAGKNLKLGATGSVDVVTAANVAVSGSNITGQTGGNFNLSSSAANVSLLASDTLDLNTGGSSALNAPAGNVTVGGNGSLNLDGSILVVNGAGARVLSGTSNTFKPGSSVTASSAGIDAVATGSLDLRQLNLTSNGNGPVSLQSGANLTVGRLATSSGARANLTGANIIIDSMDRISGGNYTITTPGNLTELNPATNPPVLAALNITAGRAFNTNINAANSSFSIPNVAPANLTVLVTAGNDSVFNSSASFQNFGGDVQPGHITGQTGDIYVDGALFYGGEPPTPPPPPPPPPPVPPIPPEPVVEPTVPDAIAAVQQNPLTAEQRSQILAQSNLALGNLGSFSRVLSDSERERLTVRQDSLNQTWALDPFSPTLALTLPGGTPLVYPSELKGLEALLLMSSPGDDPEEKARGAYNVIVDQELREIWEIRYWRHLLEGFVIWEDRE